jgi:hypothetical protein
MIVGHMQGMIGIARKEFERLSSRDGDGPQGELTSVERRSSGDDDEIVV